MLRELSQTSHVGEGLKPHDNDMVERTAADRSQQVLKNIDKKEQVDVELFNLYAIRKCLNHPTCLDANISP